MAVRTEPGLQTCVVNKKYLSADFLQAVFTGEAMIANYHTHTVRCRHATGTEEEYIQSAIRGGLKHLGFSDHTPQFFPGDYYSNMRMYPDQLEDYILSLQTIREQFRGQIDISIGLEVEYYPACFQKLMDFLQGMPIEYMIHGQHWIDNEIGDVFVGFYPSDDPQRLDRYCKQTIEAMDTGLFSYLAHPDLFWFTGDSAEYTRQMENLCEHAKKCGLPLELNLLGIRGKRSYPVLRFWEIAGQVGCDAVLGSDAHRPEDVVDPASEEIAMKIIAENGLHFIENPALKPL